MELFTDFFDAFRGWEMLSRVGHILAGITWIGLLYFFNFIQTPAFAELSDGARSEVMRKLTWRALWWFRWSAMLTFLFGLSILAVQDYSGSAPYFQGQRGTAILTGVLFGITMFLNVWGIIWRNQQIVIGSAEAVANGGDPDPEAPAAAKKGARASRANTLFSIPMLFFMVFAAHGFAVWDAEMGSTWVYWIVVLVLWGVIEASALGLLGGYDNAINTALFDKHRDTIIAGFVLLVVIYLIGWELLLPV